MRTVTVRVDTLDEANAIEQATAKVPEYFRIDKKKTEFIKAKRLVRFYPVKPKAKKKAA